MRGLILTIILFAACNSLAVHANDRLIVVTHQNNPVNTMDRSQLIDLFMGKYVAFPDGRKALPVDNNGNDVLKAKFYEKLVGLSVARVNAYWSRIRFTGRARPPEGRQNSDSVVDYIRQHENAIGYIPASDLTDELKVVHRFDE